MTVLSWFFPSNLLCHCSSSWLVGFLDTFLLKPPSHSTVPLDSFFSPSRLPYTHLSTSLLTVFSNAQPCPHFLVLLQLRPCRRPPCLPLAVVSPGGLPLMSVHSGHSDRLKINQVVPLALTLSSFLLQLALSILDWFQIFTDTKSMAAPVSYTK